MKKIIKGILGLLLIALSVSIFTGCDKNETVEVGIVLPSGEQKRWLQDKVQFEEMLEGVGFSSEVLFSQASSITEKENVKKLVDKGMKVLIICPEDSSAAAESIEYATENGVKVITYDRLITNSEGVNYFVSFDSEEVGALQAQYLVDNRPEGKNIPLYLYTGLPADDNAAKFLEGSWEVLQPYLADGTFRIVNCPAAVANISQKELTQDAKDKIVLQVATDWSYDVAYSKAQAHITQASSNDKGDVLVLAPNDDTARGIYDAFIVDPEITSIKVTGQDAGLDSVNYIIQGKQSMTVFKNTNTLAKYACKTAMSILKGEEVETNAESNNGKLYVPTLKVPVELVTIDNYVEKLIDSGYYTMAQLNQFK